MLKSFSPFAYCLISIALAISACRNHPSVKEIPEGKEVLFQSLPHKRTHIDFVNQLTEGLNTNVLMYEYFYNGGGVAIGDFNGDQLEDIYFTANMVANKLYINRGNMIFDDVTEIAGVTGRSGPWKTGVTMADVNGDGLPDLYVCYSGKLPVEKRCNELYINKGSDDNGIPHFEEQASRYGLADPAYSTQAAFFDFDVDGDLDMFLLNHNPNSLPILDEATTAEILKTRDVMSGSKLYRHEKDQKGDSYFRDVTVSSGIKSATLSYGLGIGISDIDKNGYPDIYVSNDYDVPDHLYMNNGDGTFTDRIQHSLRYNTQFSMGNDLADINNDGLIDIFTLDMLPEDHRRQKLLKSPDNYELFNLHVNVGFHYQYMRNMLQLNNGNGSFSEIGQMSGISNTDWSWAALWADYDNDGWKDLFVTNGYLRDYTNLDFIKYMGDFIQNNEKIWRKDLVELIHEMPASDIVNSIYKNNEDLTFTDQRKSWGFTTPSNSNGAAYADLDNDGDMDLVVNNINNAAFIYENRSNLQSANHFIKIKLRGAKRNSLGIGTRITLYKNGKQQYREQMPVRGYQSSVSPILHFGLAEAMTVDSLKVNWPDGEIQLLYGLKADQTITLYQSDAKKMNPIPDQQVTILATQQSPIVFEHLKNKVNDFKRQPLIINPKSFSGPCMVKGDINGDQLEDIYVGGAAGQSGSVFMQQANGQFIVKNNPAFSTDAGSEDTRACLFDADHNGTLDLYVCSGGYHSFSVNDPKLQDRLYINDGNGNFTRSMHLPEMLASTGSIAVIDINQDGNADLFVGGSVVPGRYPEAPQSYLLVNDGNGRFEDNLALVSPELQYIGMITDAIGVDINADGLKELVIAGEWMPVKIFENDGGKLADRSNDYFDRDYFGWWNRLLVQDLNDDGYPDIIAGNLGLNTQFKANPKEPVELYYKDFDNNGSLDPIICAYQQGKSFPYTHRDELLDHMTMLRPRFTDYKSYADATIKDIFTPEEMEKVNYLKADHLATTYWQNMNGQRLLRKKLPLEVQSSSIFTMMALDYNQDETPDLLLCGNLNQAGLKLGKLGANYGILLKGTGNGSFTYIPQHLSGLHLLGDVRSTSRLDDQLLFGINQGSVKAYKINRNKPVTN